LSTLPDYRVRLASPDDLTFLERLYASTRADELERACFPLEQRAAFCRMQFNAQQHHYALYFARAVDTVLEIDGVAIGRELLARAADELFLVDIALLPEFRNRGIGSHRLRLMIEESRRLGCPIRLYAEQGSGAEALYRRHGFVITGEEGVHFMMERAADSDQSHGGD
jgi:ribosomal protein S18 acetylase RimI-like enzyme